MILAHVAVWHTICTRNVERGESDDEENLTLPKTLIKLKVSVECMRERNKLLIP